MHPVTGVGRSHVRGELRAPQTPLRGMLVALVRTVTGVGRSHVRGELRAPQTPPRGMLVALTGTSDMKYDASTGHGR